MFVAVISAFLCYRNMGKRKMASEYQQETSPSPLTPKQIQLIRESWAKVLPIKDTAAELFYAHLFELDPDSKALFRGKLDYQGDKLMTTLTVVVNNLDNLDTIIPILQAMGKRHLIYKVQAEQFETVGVAFLWVLEQGLGDDFTDEVQAAWRIAYGLIASVMLEAYEVS